MPRKRKAQPSQSNDLTPSDIATLIAAYPLLPAALIADLSNPPGRGPWVPVENEPEELISIARC